MDYIFVFLLVAIVLVVLGILFYAFRQRSARVSVGTKEEQNKLDSLATKQLPVNNELVQLRQHLMTIVLHNERVYQNNIEIARRDFIKRGLQNPSETELLKRAIEIWQDDNR